MMKHIHDKGHYFCIRAKINSNIKIFIYDKKEKHYIYKRFLDFKTQKHHALYHKNITVGSFHFKCNLSIARMTLGLFYLILSPIKHFVNTLTALEQLKCFLSLKKLMGLI